jgi:hypothetical protein
MTKYPVYVIHGEPEELDNMLWLEDQVIDDRNMLGKSLGIRRLQTPMKSIYPLKYQCDDEVAMLKHRGKHFVDSDGKYFYNEKLDTAPLKYHKIKKVIKKEVAAVVWIKDIPFPFAIARPPRVEQIWAGILYKKGIPYAIWEFTEERKKDTWRKI